MAENDSLSFSYTIGFQKTLGHPELIVFSLNGKVAHGVFWDMFRAIRDGREFPIGQRVQGIFNGADAMLLPVAMHHYREHLLSARWFYVNEDCPCLQLIWPDPKGRFPWEPGADERFADSQIDLSPTGWRNLLS